MSTHKDQTVPPTTAAFIPALENLTLRDYFAGDAMQALVTSTNEYWPDGVDFSGAYCEDSEDGPDKDRDPQLVTTLAMVAYTYADAMVKARTVATQNGGVPTATEKPTLRDYFAGKAMLGRISRAEDNWGHSGLDFRAIYNADEEDENGDRVRHSWDILALASYHFADAMLIAQNKHLF
jgi:hypothetical protein